MLYCHLNNCRLRTGWSTGKPTAAALDPAERDAILEVIRRNEQLEVAERQRVGKLVERVEKIKERAAECGPRNCRCVSATCNAIICLVPPNLLLFLLRITDYAVKVLACWAHRK